ncbi:hypothetical protein [Pseudarthrobacter albicanus]|jgi:hypothetical protein|uniref:hypothetical protein n=1 Tax=Pseudarthrobacter albicanus TaxID=2823873 RepID=UPI001BA99382|nr:hypothetical protein [Pseudarthrobacter albicanus]
MTAVAHRGGGRPSKGLRKYIGFRVPAEMADQVAQVAEAEGVTITDYVASVVAKQLQVDLNRHVHKYQEELPIGRIAS